MTLRRILAPIPAALFLGAFVLLPLASRAAPLTLNLPQPASQTVAGVTRNGDLLLPSGPWSSGAIPGMRLAGRVSQTAWRIDQPLATVDLMARLRADVLTAGFLPIFECQARDCGGFDFRYALPVLPEPDMHVDLGDFRFLSARRGNEAVTLLVSRSDQAAFVQITLIGPQLAAPSAQADASAATGARGIATASGPAADGQLAVVLPAPETDPDPAGPDPANPDPAAPPTGDAIGAALESRGRAALDDLAFASGKAELETRDTASLQALAGWLIAHPDMTVVLVGHTDATGSLSGNIALSRARAQAVRQALIDLAVPAAQMGAEGVGYLAPRASSLTDLGRQQNRRVEVVLTSTQPSAPKSEP